MAVRFGFTRQTKPQRPSHPAPRLVTTAKRLRIERGTARTKAGDLPDGTSAIFFAGRLDTNSENQHDGQISSALTATIALKELRKITGRG